MSTFGFILMPFALLVIVNSVYRAVRTDVDTRWQVRVPIAIQSIGALCLFVLPWAYPIAVEVCAAVMIAGQAALQVAVSHEWRDGPPPGYQTRRFFTRVIRAGKIAPGSDDAQERMAA